MVYLGQNVTQSVLLLLLLLLLMLLLPLFDRKEQEMETESVMSLTNIK